MTTRREFLAAAGAASLIGVMSSKALAQPLPPKSPIGIGSASLNAYNEVIGRKGGNDPIAMINYCRSLGAGGLQFTPTGDLSKVRARFEELGMYFEGNARLPATLDEDTAAFEKSLLDTKAAGGTIARTVSRAPQGSSGRRYETFKSYAEFKAWQDNAHAIIRKCLPIAERVGIKLALENHKDRQVDDHVAFLKSVSSEYLGSLIDPGNNVSILETPLETTTKLAPYVLATSLKDMGVAPYADGFLLSEVVFGTGATDQAAIFAIMKKANPKINPTEELITRDPLKIPCLTDAYWAGFPKRDEKRLADMLAWVKAKQTKLPYVDQLSPEERLKVEEDNHRKTLTWGITHLA
jgi:sugar phosphate isomerase/epimerase